MQFVVAGSYKEYIIFLQDKSLPIKNTRYTFISDPMHLVMTDNVEVLCIGEYKDSPVFRYEYQGERHIRFVDESGVLKKRV